MASRLPSLTQARGAAVMALLFTVAACAGPSATPPLPRISRSAQQCLAELDRLGVEYRSEPVAASANPACMVENPVRVTAATIPWSRPAIASCGFVVTFDRFEREAIRPLAKRYLGHDLQAITHFGAFSCRTTREGRESEHAKGLAMDIAGFELTDGSIVSVKEDWGRRGKARDFLRAVAAEACRYFNEVLTPDSDRDHVDHIHLDLGPYRVCVRR